MSSWARNGKIILVGDGVFRIVPVAVSSAFAEQLLAKFPRISGLATKGGTSAQPPLIKEIIIFCAYSLLNLM